MSGNLSGHPFRVLVVCTANIARSPLAQAMLQSSLSAPGLAFRSAGVRARPGYPADEEGIARAAARGIDLTAHRSAPVTDDLLSDADLVLTMSERQRDHCASHIPGGGSRTFTLREFVRLLADVPTGSGPPTTTDRMRWLRDQAHAARPRAVRPREPEDIADPIGRGPEVWGALERDLAALVDRIRDAVESGP